MDKLTISEVSKGFGVSTRMLRYYEKEGLIASLRREGYAYRVYDDTALLRLRQILLLRKLRIPVAQIKIILQAENSRTVVQIFQQNIDELDEEITALSTVRSILQNFAEELQNETGIDLRRLLLTQNEQNLSAIKALSFTSINFREDKTMKNLQKAEDNLQKLTDVRILYLPPATVASAHFVGENPEQQANSMVANFVQEHQLHKIKPDLRHFGFNHPNPSETSAVYGYEAWVTIPDEMPVSPPLVKKQFGGGLYAAHMISFGNFNEWEWLFKWVHESEQYSFAGNMEDPEHMCGLLEEHLNYINHALLENTEPEGFQLDLLIPIQEKE